MAQYVGWGGLSDCFDERHSKYTELKALLTEDEYEAAAESTLTAFYTPPVVIRSIYQALANMGFKTGNLLEMKEISGPYGPETACLPMEGQELGEQLPAAIQNVTGTITEYVMDDPEAEEEDQPIPADPDVRNFSYTVC